ERLGRERDHLIDSAPRSEEEGGEAAGGGAGHDDALRPGPGDDVIQKAADIGRGLTYTGKAKLVPTAARIAEKCFLDRIAGGHPEKLKDRHADAAGDTAKEDQQRAPAVVEIENDVGVRAGDEVGERA